MYAWDTYAAKGGIFEMQTKDMISAYQTLNQVAEAAGVVLFGSTTAANLPLNELLQDFGVSCTAKILKWACRLYKLI